MARARRERIEGHWDMGDVVAHRMVTARHLRGRTQSWVAERLTRFTRSNWSVPAVSAAEGGSEGGRPRLFTANEILALSRTFDLPIPYFFVPPEDPALPPDVPDASQAGWDYIWLRLIGDRNSQKLLAAALGAGPVGQSVDVPQGDVIDDGDVSRIAAGGNREISHVSLLEAALYEFMTSALRGAPELRGGIGNAVQLLDALRSALETIESYPMDRFLNLALAEQLEEAKNDGVEADS